MTRCDRSTRPDGARSLAGVRRERAPAGRLRSRGGFSLLEAVIGIALIAVMAGVLVPNIMNHLADAENGRLAADVQSLGKAAKLFRLHVRRWPGEVQHLTQRPDTSARDPFGEPYSPKYLSSWVGPYLELVNHPERDNAGEVIMRSSRGTLIRNRFTPVEWQGSQFLQVRVDDVSLDNARAISLELDGDTVVSVGSLATVNNHAGRVRWLSTGDLENDRGSLLYLAVRID